MWNHASVHRRKHDRLLKWPIAFPNRSHEACQPVRPSLEINHHHPVKIILEVHASNIVGASKIQSLINFVFYPRCSGQTRNSFFLMRPAHPTFYTSFDFLLPLLN
jgi:hypothetical protein